MKTYIVYILHCDNGSLYTGFTTNLEKRYQAHLAGKCKYTRSFKPLAVAASWTLNSKSDALKLEGAIKKLSRVQKEALLTAPLTLVLAQFFKESE